MYLSFARLLTLLPFLSLSRARSFFYPLCPIVIYSLPFCRVPLPRSDYFSSSSSLVHPRKTAMALGSLVTVPYRSGSCKALALLPRAIEEAILCRYLRDGEYARARYLSCRIHSRMAEGREERGEGGGGIRFELFVITRRYVFAAS